MCEIEVTLVLITRINSIIENSKAMIANKLKLR